MTEEQIKELAVELAKRGPSDECLYCKSVTKGHFGGCPFQVVPRLLEERKRLKESLRALEAQGLFDRGDRSSEESGEWDSVPWAEAKDAARNALAFAEQEAP